jgi:hypothetical protein
MPTIPYLNAAGERLPGCTTVIGGNLGWNKDPLMHYAWKKGKDGKDFRDYTKDAADIGTLTHALVEADILGRPLAIPDKTPAEHLALARVGLSAFQAWARNSQLEFISTEPNLVSETYQYGATPDGIILANDAQGKREPASAEFKATKGTYADHIIQIAAGAHAWEEVTGIKLTGGYHLFRFSTENGSFHHHWFPYGSLGDAWSCFTYLRNLHLLRRPVERLAA